jgi:KTSC domain
MSWMKPVYSSMVFEVGYDADTGELLVTWSKSGRTSAYAGVSEDVANDLAEGRIASVGQFLNSDIKDRYNHRYR